MAKGMKLYYDAEADILYFKKKKTSKTQISREVGNDLIVRLNKKSGKLEAVTILNFTRRFRNSRAKALPFSADLHLVK
ncbi:MAG: DUF2283 domain-containing protein [Nitrososphaera sp.]|nr:DUF2283 domain-containing protein [Nitrososphaera sp.]MCI0707971.1 DUF2283 domain-containing protein [Ignavibacteriota bacterium]